VHSLLAEPTADQARLLNTIYEGRKHAGWPAFHRINDDGMKRVGTKSLWPTFQYVESELYRRFEIDAKTVLGTLPMVIGPGGTYGWVWHDPPNPLSLRIDSRLLLTISGLRYFSTCSG
jgi:hypothetical protein